MVCWRYKHTRVSASHQRSVIELLQYSATNVARNAHIKLFTIIVKTLPPETAWISLPATHDFSASRKLNSVHFCEHHFSFLWVFLLVSSKTTSWSVSTFHLICHNGLLSLKLLLALNFSNCEYVPVHLLFEDSWRQLIVPGGDCCVLPCCLAFWWVGIRSLQWRLHTNGA